MTSPLLAGNQTASGGAPASSAAPPTRELGYEYGGAPGWGYFSGYGPGDDVPQLMWPNGIPVYHQMRTDAQIDALIKSVVFPVRGLNWLIKPNGALDEQVQDFSDMFQLPIQGNNDEFLIKGRPTFDHDDHLRMALLAPTVYGHMPFEYIGDVDATDLKWRMTNLAPRMPQTIAKWNVARNGDLISLTQWDPTHMTPAPIPESQLACYTWDLEGGNWAGRSMLRPLYKHWLLKDRLLRIDAIKNERFGAGIPVGKAPVGGDPAEYAKIAERARASERGGVGMPDGGSLDILGIRGTLPDTIASIRYQDEAMARSFLAMFMQLGQTETGSRALGDSFIDFFTDALWGFVKWYCATTNRVFYRITDWNYGPDAQSPLIVAEETEERKLDAEALGHLVQSGALVVDAELQGWIRKQFNMPSYEGGAPLPTKPATPVQSDPAGLVLPNLDSNPIPADVTAGGSPSKGTKKDKRLKENKVKIVEAHADHDQATHGNRYGDEPEPVKPVVGFHGAADGGFGYAHVRVVHPKASSQTVDDARMGHRQPTAVEVRAATNFDKMQQAWQKATTTLVDDWDDIREQQIEELEAAVKAAYASGDADAIAAIQAPVLGDDLILDHMKTLAEGALKDAAAEAKAQGVTLPTVTVDDISDELAGRATAIARLMANGISQSAASQTLLRYGVGGMSADDVAAGVRTQLESLSDSYLNDVLGGALTQAQNTARRAVIQTTDDVEVYASELLDENTCEVCADADGTEYGSVADATADYPAGGNAECLGGPRCRGTLVAVYGEGKPE